MKIPIVDEEDEIITYKERDETTREDIRRIIALYVFDTNARVLIAKRHKDKKIDPNCWGPAVAGTVDQGYDYESTVLKEAKEEIGLQDIAPIFFRKIYYETETAKRFCSQYYVVINSETAALTIQEDEVSEIKWISLPDLEEWVNKSPKDFTPNFEKGSLASMKEINATLLVA